MVQLQDYNGPFQKVVGTLTRKLDRQSVHLPHYKQGIVLCSLEIKDKFFLFLNDSIDPETIVGAGFDAGISQAKNDDAPFGQGGKGYAKRLAASYTDEIQYRFFKEFAYPTVFSKTRGITGWAKARQGGVSCTPWLTPWWRTGTMARPCLTFPNGWEKSAQYRSATSIIQERGAALGPRLRILLSTSPWTSDMTSFGNFGRKLRENCASPSVIRTNRRRMRFRPGGNLCAGHRLVF